MILGFKRKAQDTVDTEVGEIHGDMPNIPQELTNNIAAEAGRVVDIQDINSLDDSERAERAGAIMIDIAKRHFEENPKSEYIDLVQNSEFKKIISLLTQGNENVSIRFNKLRSYVENLGFGVARPSSSYFTEAYSHIPIDYFGISKYKTNSVEFENMFYSSNEFREAIDSNRSTVREAA